RKIILNQKKEKFYKTSDYKNAYGEDKKDRIDKFHKKYFKESENFYLTLYSIYALFPLYERELKIQEFIASNITRIYSDYRIGDAEFSACYPTVFKEDMQKEIEDKIAELKSSKYKHIVDSYIPIKDAERSPKHPLTNALLKYSGFYLFGFQPDYVTKLADKLFKAKLISNYETDGWYIEDDYVEEMITILNQNYKEHEVLQYRRKFVDLKTDRSQHAIIPLSLRSEYFPKNIEKTSAFNSIHFENNKERENAIKLYEFIFYTTLSTQMRNSVYDKSRVQIKVGNNMLKEEANYLIEGQKNWEKLTGSFMEKLTKNSNTTERGIVFLPELKPGDILTSVNIYPYTRRARTPCRYGIGRFITQILEKYGIGSNSDHDDIVKNLINSKVVIEDENILYPQENAMFLMKWLTENIPSLVDLEYLKELQEKIEAVSENRITLNSLLTEINMLIDGGFKMFGYEEDEAKPSESKIKLVKAIAARNKVPLNESIFSSTAKCDLFLAQYPEPEPIKVGSCPKCNSVVFQKEFTTKDGEVLAYFSCENFRKNGGCNFSLWDNYVYNFFSYRGIELFTTEDRRESLRKILSKKRGYLFTGFLSKTQKSYDANVLLVEGYNQKKNCEEWVFDLKFPKK
ncbi:MAG: DNA topoisomerase, partial [Arcobacteraceae bacterium]